MFVAAALELFSPVLKVLDNLLLRPLMLLCESFFVSLANLLHSPGWALILLAVLINLLLLPVYFQMEKTGHDESEKRKAMDREVARLKGQFKGRELYYYIRTIHRHYDYRPLASLLSASDLLLQMVVFSTAYRYLAGVELLDEVSFWGISDLSQPDGLLFGFNLLPVVMTAANIGSLMIYVDEPKKRRQGFALAALFLVLLYRSPAGLVLYWTSSNVFSWLRNYVARRVVGRLPQTWLDGCARFARQE